MIRIRIGEACNTRTGSPQSERKADPLFGPSHNLSTAQATPSPAVAARLLANQTLAPNSPATTVQRFPVLETLAPPPARSPHPPGGAPSLHTFSTHLLVSLIVNTYSIPTSSYPPKYLLLACGVCTGGSRFLLYTRRSRNAIIVKEKKKKKK